MGEIRSSFQRRKKSASIASSNSASPPPHSAEASLTNAQLAPSRHDASDLSQELHRVASITRRSPSSQSYLSTTGSGEPHTPPAADFQYATSRILFQDVPLTRSMRLERDQHHLSSLAEDAIYTGEDGSHALWPESQHNTTIMQPQSQYFNNGAIDDPTLRGFQKPSSHIFRDLNSSNTDSLQYLLTEEKGLKVRLQELLSMHADISAKGMSTHRVRRLIGDAFKSLEFVYQGMRELYEAQYRRRVEILRTFELWQSTKTSLLEEVKEIRSLDHDEGRRLAQLKEEHLSVDEDIKKLEQRLKQLKDKKSVLKGEIDQVESIIDSRSSSHMEQLREIERSEKLAIVKLSEEKSMVSQMSQMDLNDQTSMLGSFLMRFGAQSYVQPASMLSPEQVIEIVKRQVASFQDGVNDFLNKETVFKESQLIWEDMSDVISTLEKDLAVTLKSQTSDAPPSATNAKIESLLTKTLTTLEERVESLEPMNDILKSLFNTEITTLKKAIRLVDPQKAKQADFRPSPQPAHTAPARPTFVTSSLSEPSVSTSPPDVPVRTFTSTGKTSRTGSFGNRLKDNLVNIKKATSNSVTKPEKTD